ncbi:hypothetical protein ACFQHP_12180 [Halomicroarcula sp. GCM10025743]|uniref:hypothetical protein n=2 Tax=Haloarcula TaxID=2237 RepID=UPI003610C774
MLRRSFLAVLSTVSALPVIPDRLDPSHPPTLPPEGSLMFWYHFYSAIERDRPMSTERARRKTVEELTLQNLPDAEAVRLLELANEGVYDTDDMPERWHGVFEQMEQRI